MSIKDLPTIPWCELPYDHLGITTWNDTRQRIVFRVKQEYSTTPNEGEQLMIVAGGGDAYTSLFNVPNHTERFQVIDLGKFNFDEILGEINGLK